MAVHKTMDELRENGATIVKSRPELMRYLLDANKNDMDVAAKRPKSKERDFQNDQLAIAAGNRKGQRAGMDGGRRVENSDGELVSQEEKDAEELRDRQFAHTIYEMGEIVSDAIYDSYLEQNYADLEAFYDEYDDIEEEMSSNQNEIDENDQEQAQIRENIKPVTEAEQNHSSAVQQEQGLTQRVQSARRVRDEGGALDRDGNEYVRLGNGPDGKPRYGFRDEFGNTFPVQDNGQMMTGPALQQHIDDTKVERDAARGAVAQTAEELQRVRDVHGGFYDSQKQRLEYLQQRREQLMAGQDQNRERLDRLNRQIDRTQSTITYLENPETRRLMQEGKLTVADMQKNSSALAWNVFREKNGSKYNLESSAMNIRESEIFERIKTNPSFNGSTSLIRDSANDDGKGIKTPGIDPRSAFSSAAIGTPVKPLADQPDMGPSIVPVTVNPSHAFRPGGMG